MDKAAKSSKNCELSKSLYESFCKTPDGRLKIRTDRRTVIISKMTLKVCLNSDISDIIYQIFFKIFQFIIVVPFMTVLSSANHGRRYLLGSKKEFLRG